MNYKQLLVGLALSIVGVSANALLLDFTDENWETSYPGITVTAVPDDLTFNGGDNGGCLAGQAFHGLSCDGDGLGVKNDEITETGSTSVNQSITIEFASAMNVSNVYLLDLFANEGSGEVAVIAGTLFHSVEDGSYNVGGYWDTGFSAQGITSLTFTGNADNFSDYAIAAIEVNPVPLPGSLVLLGSVLMGVGLIKRKKEA